MINPSEIIETIRMIESENLDIRTITMGISLWDCAAENGESARRKIYDKIAYHAQGLVEVGDEIALEYGIPIINKRISVTPLSLIAGAGNDEDYFAFADTLDQAAGAVGVNFIGGFSALVHKGYTKGDVRLIGSIPEALAGTERVCASVNVATTKSGINMDAVRHMGDTIRETALLTRDRDAIGCAKLVVFANAVEDNPFMAGALHGPGEPECSINVGISGPGVMREAVGKLGEASFDQLAETVKRTAFKITRLGQLVAHRDPSRGALPVEGLASPAPIGR